MVDPSPPKRPATNTRRQRVLSRISEAADAPLRPQAMPEPAHAISSSDDPAHLVDALPQAQDDQLVSLPLSAVRPNPDQPRKSFPKRQMDELVDSIRQSGLVQPIVVRPAGDGQFQLVAGERRYRAFRQLAVADPTFRRIPAVVKRIDDSELPIVSLIENIVRDDLNPIERAEALHALKSHLDATWEQVADKVGISVRAVHFLTGTLKLRAEFKEALAAGEIAEKHGRALQRLSAAPQAAYELFEYIRGGGISGDDALAISAVLRKYPTMSAEQAHRYLLDGKVQAKVAPPQESVGATPGDHFSRGLRLALRYHSAVNVDQLGPAERKALLAVAKPALTALRHVIAALESRARKGEP